MHVRTYVRMYVCACTYVYVCVSFIYSYFFSDSSLSFNLCTFSFVRSYGPFVPFPHAFAPYLCVAQNTKPVIFSISQKLLLFPFLLKIKFYSSIFRYR